MYSGVTRSWFISLFRHKALLGRVLLLLVLLMGALGVLGCGARSQPKGWSGVAVADDALFVGSMEGKLVAVGISSHSRLRADITLKSSQPRSGFGCAAASTVVAIYGTPVVSGGLVYVAGYDGRVRAFNASSGMVEWKYPSEGNLDAPIVGGLAAAQGMVFFGGSDSKVYALDTVRGRKQWEFSTGDKIWSTPVIDGDTLYIGSFDNKLYALNTADGSKKWEYETEGAVASTPLVYEGTVYFGSLDRHIYAVNAADGSLKWRSAVEADKWFWARPVVANDVIYAPSLDGKVYALDTETGREAVDAIDLGSPISSSPVLVDDLVIIATVKGEVYSIDIKTNQPALLAELGEKEKVHTPLAAGDGVVYIHTQERETLVALNARTGVKMWSLTLSSK